MKTPEFIQWSLGPSGFRRSYPLCLALALSVAGLAFWWSSHAAPVEPGDPLKIEFAEWFEACRDLPSNRREDLRYTPRDQLPLPRYAQFESVVEAFLEHCQNGPLSEANRWLGEKPSENTFFNLNRTPGVDLPFQPFARRLQVPPGAAVILQGDLHGDVRSLLHGLQALHDRGYLDGFELTRPDVYMVFLGDYTDRGVHGVEVLYTILRLKLANPDRVWLVRGNHEDLSLVIRYGFVHEGHYKYGRDFKERRVTRLYDFLPAVLYLGCEGNYVQCNHGGMEPGYQVRGLLNAEGGVSLQLLGELKRADFLREHPEFIDGLLTDDQTRRFARLLYQNFRPISPTSPDLLGFMWGDFALQAQEPALRWDEARPGWKHGSAGTRMLLGRASNVEAQLRAVIRAHQHARRLNPMMRRLLASRGLFEHWQTADVPARRNAEIAVLKEALDSRAVRPLTEGAVYTLNVSPDSAYGLGCDYDEHTLAILRVEEAFEDWRFELLNVKISVP